MIFDNYLLRWDLVPDGEPIFTRSSQLLPVRYKNSPAILKIALDEEERQGCHVMTWWNGVGAAPVLEHDDNAILLARAMGTRVLKQMAHAGLDDEASKIICAVAATLHRVNKPFPTELMPLRERFKALLTGAQTHGGIFMSAAQVTEELLVSQPASTVLHGDLHHENVLDFNGQWLAIDPKGLWGDRGFDFANIFCNPDIEVALAPGRLEKQAAVVAQAAQIPHQRLLKWIFAYASLSALWIIEDGDAPDLPLGVALRAQALLASL